jgi:hypothetical protein
MVAPIHRRRPDPIPETPTLAGFTADLLRKQADFMKVTAEYCATASATLTALVKELPPESTALCAPLLAKALECGERLQTALQALERSQERWPRSATS